MPEPIVITIRGFDPKPQGSKRHVGNGVMVESCREVKHWRHMVTNAAVQRGCKPLFGDIAMTAEYIISRPKSHFGTGKNASKLKPSAPYWVGVKPDLSKIQRSTEDALTKVAYTDDARIVSLVTFKRYAAVGELPGAVLTVAQAPEYKDTE